MAHASTVSTKPPETENDWAIQAINIHGGFFERWCRRQIYKASPWKVRSVNYPVEFPPQSGTMSALDIRAELPVGRHLLTLCIECKKNNPDFVDWVFFPHDRPTRDVLVSHIVNRPYSASHWHVNGGVISLHGAELPMTDEGRETRGQYLARKGGDKTKTSNAAISDASRQVALATQAIATEEIAFSSALRGHSAQPAYERQIFLPIIVTTAQLYLCDFDVDDVDPTTGTIELEKASLRPRVHYGGFTRVGVQSGVEAAWGHWAGSGRAG